MTNMASSACADDRGKEGESWGGEGDFRGKTGREGGRRQSREAPLSRRVPQRRAVFLCTWREISAAGLRHPDCPPLHRLSLGRRVHLSPQAMTSVLRLSSSAPTACLGKKGKTKKTRGDGETDAWKKRQAETETKR